MSNLKTPANGTKRIDYMEVVSITLDYYNGREYYEMDELEVRGLSHQILNGLLEGGLIVEENSVTLKIQRPLWIDDCLTKKTEIISGQLHMVGGKFVIRDDNNNEYTLFPRFENAVLFSS